MYKRQVLDLFSAAGYEIQIHITQRQKDAAEAAARWGQEKDLVVCSGGDGTLNEVISGMMELPRAPLLGYIPSGSTNDYASSLEIPKQTMDAARNVLEGQPFPIDVGKFCKDRYFVYIAAFGAFTEISYQTSQGKKNHLIKHGWICGKRQTERVGNQGLYMKTTPCRSSTVMSCTVRERKEKTKHT